ncbi:MAG: NupC/NupG family nucleoside CNT transporter [Candidatus Riflebacteria bacterium]|nr:NupC/NupG family nucleoside CNT transporter [Candidatus Riflebacteria bacterium]
MDRVISLIGIPVFLAICFWLSTDRKKINWTLVFWGIAMQFVFALLILRTDLGKNFFQVVNDVITALLNFTGQGASFVFGNLATGQNCQVGSVPAGFQGPGAFAPLDFAKAGNLWANHGALFAFGVLPTIIFFSSFMTVLYHLGIMQRVVYFIAVIMQRFMKASGAETLCAAANIFIGQTEAPLVIKPYLSRLTLSELHCVMTAGMATIAGGVMAVYAGILKGGCPEAAGHLLAASVMSAPAAVIISKMLVPETEVPETDGHIPLNVEQTDKNVIDAAARGASEGVGLAINVAAMLIAFIALVAMINHVWGLCCHTLTSIIPAINLKAVDSLQKVMGFLNAPFAWLMGMPSCDLLKAGELLGEHTIINEFYAYVHLGNILDKREIIDSVAVTLQPRTITLMIYALCGFANIGSIGIQIGGIGGLAPNRRGDIAKLGIYALIGGTLASYLTACIAGVILN